MDSARGTADSDPEDEDEDEVDLRLYKEGGVDEGGWCEIDTGVETDSNQSYAPESLDIDVQPSSPKRLRSQAVVYNQTYDYTGRPASDDEW